MRIKIVGDGTVARTEVINAETGERLEGVKAVAWALDAGKDRMFATATVAFYNVPIDMEMDATLAP